MSLLLKKVSLSVFIVLVCLILFEEMLLRSEFTKMKTATMSDPFKNILKIPNLHVENYTGNLPDIYLDSNYKKPGKNNKCGQFPDFFTLKFHNDYWQKQEFSKGAFYLLSAYLDHRNGSYIRLIAISDLRFNEEKLYCQFWYENFKVEIVESEVPFWIFRKGYGADEGFFHHPYVLTCPLVFHKNQLPVSVSLVENRCDLATNNIKITYKEVSIQKNFVVCVKGLNFPFSDFSVRLVEWIELLNILGVGKINFYEFNVHPNVEKVLDYYTRTGFVEVTPLSVVGEVSNEKIFQWRFLRSKVLQRRLQEVIPYTDCLYKHLNEYKYVVLLDTDEVIIPYNQTWVELIQTLETTFPNKTSYVARNVYFMDSHLHRHDWFEDIPEYMHMLQHVYRSKNHTKPFYFVKGFHSTAKVFALHNHFPIGCLGKCAAKEMDVELGQLQHYREGCTGGVGNCEFLESVHVMDTRIWNYKEEMIRRCQEVLKDLQFLT